MRYVVGILLLASPAFADEPACSWRSRTDDPKRIYLYLDGNQIGGWDYKAKHYRPFDGKDWGPPTGAAPVPPPAQRPIVTMQRPIVLTPQSYSPSRLRGPLKVRLGTAMGQFMADVTMQMLAEIPRAVVDAMVAEVIKGLTRSEASRPAGDAPAARVIGNRGP